MAESVEIFEVGPRDGLQNEPQLIPLAQKVALIDLLSTAGFRRIEVASFVSPKWVPQMAESAKVLAQIRRAPGVSYTALTPNLRGLGDALAAKADEVAIFGSASEGFSRENINCSISESLERFKAVISAASAVKMKVRGYVSCVVDCPFDGPTPPEKVAEVVAELMAMGCYEVSLGDTLGRATPDRISAMLSAVLARVPAARLAGHYHDTSGRALDNIAASLEFGLRAFDASIGGLGGCPYAPGAAGNVGTGAVHAFLTGRGYATGLDNSVLTKAADMARSLRGQGAEWSKLS